MDLFISTVPVFVPYLDTECRASLLVVSKQIRETCGHILHVQLPEEVVRLIRKCITILQNSGQGDEEPTHLVSITPRNHLFSVALGIFHWSPAELASQLQYFSSNVFARAALGRTQKQLRHCFEIAPENLGFIPEIQSIESADDIPSIIVARNGCGSLKLSRDLHRQVDKLASTTEIRFHLRKINAHCSRYNAPSADSCPCDSDRKDVSNIFENIGGFQHSICLLNGFRHFTGVVLDLLKPYNVDNAFHVPLLSNPFEPRAIDKLVVIVGEEIEITYILRLRRNIVERFSHSGKAYVDIYLLMESQAAAEAFFVWGNHVWPMFQGEDLYDLFDAAAWCNPEIVLNQATVLKQFRRKLEEQKLTKLTAANKVDWVDFAYRAPETLPYRVSRPKPSFHRANVEMELWLQESYSVTLENPDVLQSDGTVSVASLALKVDPVPGSEESYYWRSEFQIYSETVFYSDTHVTGDEFWLNRSTRQFESTFWLLTGNHWHSYPHRFKAIPGLYRPCAGTNLV